MFVDQRVEQFDSRLQGFVAKVFLFFALLVIPLELPAVLLLETRFVFLDRATEYLKEIIR